MGLTLPNSDELKEDLKQGIENAVGDVRSTYDRVMYGLRTQHEIEIFTDSPQEGTDEQKMESESPSQAPEIEPPSMSMTD